jgi:hypothetical protein
VCNKAALIASDCAIPELARELCHRQHALFAQAGPLPDWAVKLSLQPVLNIARQLIREGDAHGAYTMLEHLHQAARRRTDTINIDGRPIALSTLTNTPDAHKTVCTLIWAALLADGTRALALAGRWREAADRAAEHRGVGDRLLDGRQAAILALLHEGRAEQAAAMAEHSTITEPWEHAVQSLLRVLCLRATGADTADHHTTMLTAAHTLTQQQDPSTALPRTRIALTALDLASTPDEAQLQTVRASAISNAAQDAYTVRDLLEHPQTRAALTTRQRHDLTALARACGLGTGLIPSKLHHQMSAAVERAETTLTHALRQAR